MVRDFDVTLADGRTLSCQEAGATDGLPIVAHWGTPMGKTLYQRHVPHAEQLGARLISFDRPGYGGSTPNPMRSVADVATDTKALADSLGIERFATWGVSGGGPHALACAGRFPDQVTAAAALASVAPWKADGLDWLAGMGEDNVEEFTLALQGREALEPFIAGATKGILAAEPSELFAGLESLVSDPDKAALKTDVGEFMAQNMQAALGASYEGWIEDDLAFVRPWGFELSDIRVPTLLWQGTQDLMVPPDHGRWLGTRIPDVDARISEEDGHLTLLTTRIADTLDWLMEKSAAS